MSSHEGRRPPAPARVASRRRGGLPHPSALERPIAAQPPPRGPPLAGPRRRAAAGVGEARVEGGGAGACWRWGRGAAPGHNARRQGSGWTKAPPLLHRLCTFSPALFRQGRIRLPKTAAQRVQRVPPHAPTTGLRKRERENNINSVQVGGARPRARPRMRRHSRRAGCMESRRAGRGAGRAGPDARPGSA